MERKRIEETLKKHQENLELIAGERNEALKESNLDLKMEDVSKQKRLEQQLFQAQRMEALLQKDRY